MVGGWKERGLRRIAAEAAGLVVDAVPRPSVEALTFVPPDGDRNLRRGHHPAERLARELGRCWELPVVLLLARQGASRRQRGLSLPERRRNVARAFAARPCDGAVLLVDDVYTTGATAHAAASALRTRVEVVTFARAIRAPRLG